VGARHRHGAARLGPSGEHAGDPLVGHRRIVLAARQRSSSSSSGRNTTSQS
jgi:hypothetical protein